MTKAYDLKALGEKLKEQGVDLGKETLEEGAKVVVNVLFPWLNDSALASENKVDDILRAFYPQIHAHVLELAEAINKED